MAADVTGGKAFEQILHHGEEPAVVRRGTDGQRTVAEDVGQYERGLRHAEIMNDDFALTGRCGTLGHGLGHALGMAVHRPIADDEARLRFARRKAVVHAQCPGDFVHPHRAVRGTNHLDVQRGELFQPRLHRCAELAEDGGVVAFHFGPVVGSVHLRVDHVAIERTEATEGIAREEDMLRFVVGHHRFGPMEHRSEVETQLVVSQVEGTAFLDGDVGFGSRTIVTLYHAHRFGVSYEANAGIVLADKADRT